MKHVSLPALGGALFFATQIFTVSVAHGGDAVPPRPDPAHMWREECGSCHVAYPARFLPAASWRVLMQSLDKHFGVNASLDAATNRAIQSYLEAGASLYHQNPKSMPEIRISRQPWFEREHSEVPDIVWRRNSVRDRANCGVCHSGAEQGIFNEDGIRIPK